MHLRLQGSQHFILLGVLLAFFFGVSEGPQSVIGRLWWMVGCGLFLLWQPIVSAERRLSSLQAIFVLLAVAVLVLRLDWAWLAASLVLLAALTGGKVVVARERHLGWFYLLAFTFLAVLLFVWVSPRLYGHSDTTLPAAWLRWLNIGTLVATALAMPWRRVENEARVFDFLVSLLILLILSSVLMAVGILVAIERVSHLEALVRALLGLGGAVLLLSWIWNPRLGFGGFGPMMSRYLFRFGFPFEDWLRQVSELFDQEEDPEAFLDRALASFSELPWVVGGVIERQGGASKKNFGREERHRAVLEHGDLKLILFTSYDWSASLIWQANLLFKLVVEFYRARQRERLLRQLQYVQAVYETGSRVTHDVKNLLQSLEGLCFAVGESSGRDGAQGARADDGEVLALMRRQLPVISQRLRSTLDKLAAPVAEDAALVSLGEWWQVLQQRYQSQRVGFAQSSVVGERWVPQTLFDNVAENLIGNALQKRLQESSLRVAVTLEAVDGEVILRVSDDGSPVSKLAADALFIAPVSSGTGLGVGLFHAGQLAARLGYRLSLSENRPEAVVFTLIGPSKAQPAELGRRSVNG